MSYLSTADDALRLLLPATAGAADAATAAVGDAVLSRLRSLSLACTSTSDEVVGALGAHTRALTALNLSSCLQLSDAPVAGLLAALPRLTSCDLSYLPISDGGALESLALLPRLALVNLEGCPLVTERGLSHLAHTLHHLQARPPPSPHPRTASAEATSLRGADARPALPQYANVSGCDVDVACGDFTPRGDQPLGSDAGSAAPPPLLTPRSTPHYIVAPQASGHVLSAPEAAP